MQIIDACSTQQHANLVLCSTQSVGEVQLIHPDPEIISLHLMFRYFGLSQ